MNILTRVKHNYAIFNEPSNEHRNEICAGKTRIKNVYVPTSNIIDMYIDYITHLENRFLLKHESMYWHSNY